MAFLRDMLATEDWWAVWLGALLLAAAATSALGPLAKVTPWAGDPLAAVPPATTLLTLFACLGGLTALAIAAMGGQASRYALGFPLVFAGALLAQIVGAQETVQRFGLEYVLWALLLGLLVSNLTALPPWGRAGARTELFIKTGLVLLGAEILFPKILALGVRGLGIGWIVPPVVMLAMYHFGTRVLRMTSKPLVATIAAETAVCGVSAAIAVGAATRATRQEVSYAISLCLLFTVAMMVLMPALAGMLGLTAAVAGAWIGGTVDSTGAVVAAAAMLGGEAMEVAAVVKMIQNILIGIIAFVVALLWVSRVDRETAVHPDAREIWARFPKFILGFAAASLLFSGVLLPLLGPSEVEEVLKTTKELRSWLFAMAFVSIGLESPFRELAQVSRDLQPIVLYVVGQTLNIVLSLVAAWLLFG